VSWAFAAPSPQGDLAAVGSRFADVQLLDLSGRLLHRIARNLVILGQGTDRHGRLCAARDPDEIILAEGQDYSGTNNANMSTPADGGSPRMQMYVWTSPTPDRDGDIDRNDAGCGLLGCLSDGTHRRPIALLHGKDAAQGQYHDNPDKQIPFIHASAGPDGIAQPGLPLYVSPRF
jgi:hypothetical protein